MCARAVARPSTAYWQAVADLRANPGQWQAYNSDGHCVVLAGPGSGKTKTLTVKIAKMLIEDITEPRGLVCMTYNTECARELTRRLERLGVTASANVFIGTVHSFCLQNVILPYSQLAGIELPADFRIALKSEQEKIFARAVKLEIGDNERPSWWRQRADEYRRTRVDRGSPEWEEDEQVATLVSRYEILLREDGLIDFDDMVLIGLKLIESYSWVRRALNARFPVVVVDEYQDLGVPLHRIVLRLCIHAGARLFAVGDPDQSIYGFAGARPELLRSLAASPDVESVQLPFNYRSGPTIVRAAEIALGESRGYQARGRGVGTVDFHERPNGLEDQARFICEELIPDAQGRIEGLRLGDIAVLYVDKNDGDVIASVTADHEYATIRIDAGAAYPKTPFTRWLEDCAAWCAGGWRTGVPRLSLLLRAWAFMTNLRWEHDRRAEAHRAKLVRFLLAHRDTRDRLHTWIAAFKECCLDAVLDADASLRDERAALDTLVEASDDGQLREWSVSMLGGQGGSPNHLHLITLHSAKGLEFRVVIMMGMEQGRLPRWNANASGKREARRLFYVGLTRAKDEVHMTYSGWTKNQYGKPFFNGPSEFLLEVRDRLNN
jgi:DNA helicase-2/ATP-dependent DNA helicase PcrA